jgi:small conductance mechanosensitive channel
VARPEKAWQIVAMKLVRSRVYQRNHQTARWCAIVLALSPLLLSRVNLALAQLPPTTTPPASAAKSTETPRLPWWQQVSIGDVVSATVILLVLFVVLWLANRLHNRLVAFLASRGQRGTHAEQENRAQTLVGVLHNALRTIVIAVGAIMVLKQIHIDVTPLLGGVAVVGLAVAFGAQSLIKDYFTGFLILLEQQYMIGDVVKIGAITGKVEMVTMRLTVLRDVEGAVHFIPHGQITLVSNMTHGWSQAVFDLHVNFGEPVERIRDVFFELVAELRGEERFGPMILADPELLGVDSLGDASYAVKFALRTLPLKRWEVKRELLRRIKERFAKLQIKVTVPA